MKRRAGTREICNRFASKSGQVHRGTAGGVQASTAVPEKSWLVTTALAKTAKDYHFFKV